ncbi:adenylosuccinate synthase [Candidatus Gottesmanbacteria bacterium]|nr:adenylosuccinate synthase [Candidatus Gottesmanbacteria bacterium]
MPKMLPQIIIGAQWGDEGKGKIVDYLSRDADYIVRFNGGNNAGHTVVYKGEKFPLSLLPSGVLWKKKLLISQGVVINSKVLLKEIDHFTNRKNPPDLTIDPRCNIVMPYHQLLDAATEEAKGAQKVGSLKLGIGYCYEDRNNREGIRFEDFINPKLFKEKLFTIFPKKKKRIESVYNYKVSLTADDIYKESLEYGKRLKKYIGDVSEIVSKNINKKKIIFEGAHGTFLDANFGTYPYTTAVNTISGSVCSYIGFPPQKLDVIGVVKAYTTRVGGGPFPTELYDETGIQIGDKGAEFGTVSKRRRRCGWLDLPMLRLSHRLNGFSYLIITKLDVLSGLSNLKIADYYQIGTKKIFEFPSALDQLKKAKPIYINFRGWTENISSVKKYQALPKNCRDYLEAIEKKLSIPIKYIAVGAERNAIIKK